MTHVPKLIAVFGWSTLTFLITLFLTPLYLRLATRFKLGKQIRDTGLDGKTATVFRELHAKKSGTPTMGVGDVGFNFAGSPAVTLIGPRRMDPFVFAQSW